MMGMLKTGEQYHDRLSAYRLAMHATSILGTTDLKSRHCCRMGARVLLTGESRVNTIRGYGKMVHANGHVWCPVHCEHLVQESKHCVLGA